MTNRRIWGSCPLVTMRPEQRKQFAAALDRYVAAARETLAVHAKLAQDPAWRRGHDASALVKLDGAIAAAAKRLRVAGLAVTARADP